MGEQQREIPTFYIQFNHPSPRDPTRKETPRFIKISTKTRQSKQQTDLTVSQESISR